MSSTVSWGVYLAAASCLLALLMPVIVGVAQSAQAAAQRSEFESASRVIDGLEPGMSVRLVYGGAAGDGPVTLAGHYLTVQSAGGTITEHCRWVLPQAELEPGVPYTFTLDGSSVVVMADG